MGRERERERDGGSFRASSKSKNGVVKEKEEKTFEKGGGGFLPSFTLGKLSRPIDKI